MAAATATIPTLPTMTAQPHPDRVRLLPWKVPQRVFDGLALLVITGGAIVRVAEAEDRRWVEVVAAITAITLVAVRRRYPAAVLGIAVVASATVIAVMSRPSILMLAAIVSLYTVAAERPTKDALLGGAFAMFVFFALVLIVIDPGRFEGDALAAIAWPGFATAAGSAVRGARENLAAANERAVRAEAARESEAQRRVVEERLRIARDVHDVVAHHLAVVNVQAGVASHLLDDDPATARTAIDAARSSASTAVSQLGDLLGVLRDPSDPDGPLAPTPDADSIDDLVRSFAASGLTVEHRVTGSPRPLGPTADLAVYRLIQEALTNAHKHGDGSATLEVTAEDRATTVRVTNTIGAGHDVGRSGHGLIGMRERIEAVGGVLDIDDGPGRFVVTATIPNEEST